MKKGYSRFIDSNRLFEREGATRPGMTSV